MKLSTIATIGAALLIAGSPLSAQSLHPVGKGEKNMKIRLNENEKVVKMVKEGLKKKNGYCPCRLEMNEDTKCMCKEFREQIADENFEGYCHCMLYYKEK